MQRCKGSCLFLEGDFFKQSYANEFVFNMRIMMAAVMLIERGLVIMQQTHARSMASSTAPQYPFEPPP